MHDRLLPKGMYSGSHDVFKFWEISNRPSCRPTVSRKHSCNGSLGRLIVRGLSNGTILPVTFGDAERYFCCLKLFYFTYPREIQRVLSTMCLHMNWKAHVGFNFKYLFENEGILKVTTSHVDCKCGIPQ